MNGCSACGADFSGLGLFDDHRVGKHEYTYSEGVAMSPIREDGRRCLSPEEMRSRGWELDGKGRWCNPADAERLRNVFANRNSNVVGNARANAKPDAVAA